MKINKRNVIILVILLLIFLYLKNKRFNFKVINGNIKDKRLYCKNLAFETIHKNRRDDLMILAGNRFYSDMWTRDAFITSLGLFAHKKDLELIKSVLSKQSKNIREDGLVPLRIGKKNYITKILFNIELGGDNIPIYEDDKVFSEPTDSNPQFIITSWLYYKFTKNKKFINSLKNEIVSVFDYMIKNTENGLLQGKYFHSWYDTFAFNGPDLFSNVLYLYSIKCFENLKKICPEINSNYTTSYIKIKNIFMENFWNGKYLKINPNIDVMETAGNSLAILLNILNNKQSKSIINYIDSNNIHQVTPVTIPKMPSKYLWLPGYIVGMQGYHNDRLWLWPHNIYNAAKNKLTYSYSTDSIEDVTCKYGMFFENVNYKIEPYVHWFQNTEINFSESCGSYLLSIGDANFF